MKLTHKDMDATYGKRRMLSELLHRGFNLGIDKVRSLMKRLGLVAKRPKQHRYPKGGKASIVPILAGTDCPPDMQKTPGLALHFELESLVKAGLPPWQLCKQLLLILPNSLI